MVRPSILGGRPGLQPPDPKLQGAQPFGQAIGRRITRASAGVLVQAHMDAPPQESADGEHHRGGLEHNARHRNDAL